MADKDMSLLALLEEKKNNEEVEKLGSENDIAKFKYEKIKKQAEKKN